MKPVPPRIRRVEPDAFAPEPSVRDADVPCVHVIVMPPVPVTGTARFATTGSYVPNATEDAEIRQLLETVTDTLRLAVALAPASGPASRRAAAKAMASGRFTDPTSFRSLLAGCGPRFASQDDAARRIGGPGAASGRGSTASEVDGDLDRARVEGGDAHILSARNPAVDRQRLGGLADSRRHVEARRHEG